MRRILDKFVHAAEVVKTFRNWPMLLLSYFGFFKTGLFSIGPDMVGTLRNGVRFKIRLRLANLDDAGVIVDAWTARIRHDISQRSITDNSVVIDVGAHIGAFTVMAATRARNVKVYAYEPEPDNFSLLVDNIRLNVLEGRVTPFDLAVVGVKGDGTRKLNIADSPETCSFYFSNGGKGTTVRCVTLEDIFQSNGIERCDFLKMDCEGAEFEILFNTAQEYMRKVDRIHVEYHEFPEMDHDHNDLMNFLIQAGFEVTLRSWHSHFGYIYGENTPGVAQRLGKAVRSGRGAGKRVA